MLSPRCTLSSGLNGVANPRLSQIRQLLSNLAGDRFR